MKKLLFLIFTFSLICFSCQDDEHQDENTQTILTEAKKYMPLEIGNYWIYNRYTLRPGGAEVMEKLQDTLIVTKEEIINGKKYHFIEGVYGPGTRVWRTVSIYSADSAGYIIDRRGVPIFSDINFTDTLMSYDYKDERNSYSNYLLTCKMENVSDSVTVPIGKFKILNFKGTVQFYNRELNGDPEQTLNPKYLNKYYAKEVGPILESFTYINSNTGIENRLVKYKIGGKVYTLEN